MPDDTSHSRPATVSGMARRQRLRSTLLVLCLAVLVAQIDTSVVNLAIRPIGTHFGTGVSALQWVVDSYNLVYAALLMTGGQLADLGGRRRVFVAGMAVFTIACLLCAAAPSVPVLIGGRVLAGIGAALVIPASLAIVRVVWSDSAERAKALGIWTACNGLALAIGPSVGGVLIEHFGWRSIFLVTVPFGLAALVLARRAIPESSDPCGRHVDTSGQILGGLALGSLAAAAIWGNGATVPAVSALGVSALAFVLFLHVEVRRGQAALVPLDMFRLRGFRAAVVATSGMTFGMYGVLFILPLMWQSEGILGPVGAGIALMPMALIFVIVSPFSGALVARFGTRLMSSGGLAVIGSGVVIIGATAASRSLAAAETGLALTGLGMGLATGPLMGAAVGAVTEARSGTAAALINVARMAGATVGVAVLGTLFAASGNATAGLRVAMLTGGLVQLAAAAAAWRGTRPRA